MKKIPIYKFYKHKYGDELLVDVISYEKMMPDIRRTLVFSETFYSVTLVLEGDATVTVNGKSRRLEKGLIICSIPGEVWSFETEPQMEALNLIFEREFLLSSIPADADTADLRQQNIDYYRKALVDGSHIACFADEVGAVVGCGGLCLYDEMPSPDNPTGHCAYLMNIYVRPEHQGHGTGKRIVRWLVGAALSRGIKKIYLETSEAGRLLYSVLGFSDMKDMMHLSFSE